MNKGVGWGKGTKGRGRTRRQGVSLNEAGGMEGDGKGDTLSRRVREPG